MSKTFAMLLSTSEDLFEEEIWSQLSKYAQLYDEKIIFFCGRPLMSSYSDEMYSSVVFSLIKNIPIHGIISLTGSLNNYLSPTQYHAFIRSLTQAPIVSLSIPLVGESFVECDNYHGSQQLIEHLLHHGYRKFALINGPQSSSEAYTRAQAVKQTLSKHGLEISLEVFGDFSYDSGFKCAFYIDVSQCDVIVCGNDLMAMGAINALKSKGIHVPKQIAVVGFDDIEQARLFEVPLTTVAQPFGKMACQAYDILRKSQCQHQTLTTTLKVRESCGCPKIIASNVEEERVKRIFMHKYAQSLQEYSQAIHLRAMFEPLRHYDQLFTVFHEWVKKLGSAQVHVCMIPEGSIVIEEPLNFVWPTTMRYVYGVNESESIVPTQFATQEGLPYGLLDKTIDALLIYPIHQLNVLFGYLVIDANSARNKVFASLKRELINACGRVHLINKVENYANIMQKHAHTDALTNIMNRRGFFEIVGKAFLEDVQQGKTPGIMYCDINGLKEANDKFGHEIGDQLIQDVAAILVSVFNDCTVARMGGDEFVVYISECNHTRIATFEQQLLASIVTFNIKSNARYMIALEFGLSCYDENEPALLDTLISKADLDMYGKKKVRGL